MLKTFLVIYIGSLVGGSVGPLPYDMHECLKRRLDPLNDRANPTDWTFVHHGIMRTKNGQTVRLICENRNDHPPIEYGDQP